MDYRENVQVSLNCLTSAPDPGFPEQITLKWNEAVECGAQGEQQVWKWKPWGRKERAWEDVEEPVQQKQGGARDPK